MNGTVNQALLDYRFFTPYGTTGSRSPDGCAASW